MRTLESLYNSADLPLSAQRQSAIDPPTLRVLKELMPFPFSIQRAFRLASAAALLASAPLCLAAQAPGTDQVSGYDLPPKNILDVMQAPLPPTPVISPTRDKALLVVWQLYPSIARVATPYLRLAGVRVEPKNQQARHRRRLRHHQLRHLLRSSRDPFRHPHPRCFASTGLPAGTHLVRRR
jgi:hypothetical protein